MMGMRRAKVHEVIQAGLMKQWLQLRPGTETLFDPGNPFYFKVLEDNLTEPMNDRVRRCYENGFGNERGKKMRALHSSSAMAFNLFGNGLVHIKPNTYALTPGLYPVEYEKQLHVLSPVSLAHIDVCLSCADELLFFEMKMTEWLRDTMSRVEKSYADRKKFPDNDVYDAWHRAAQTLAAEKGDTEDLYVPKARHIDVYQALKHILGIYRELFYTRGLPRVKKATLILGIWTVEPSAFSSYRAFSHTKEADSRSGADEEGRAFDAAYQAYEQTMRDEFAAFHAAAEEMIRLFAALGIEFDVRLLTVREILSCLEKAPAEMVQLRRYL